MRKRVWEAQVEHIILGIYHVVQLVVFNIELDWPETFLNHRLSMTSGKVILVLGFVSRKRMIRLVRSLENHLGHRNSPL